jgi:uncharacterized protein YciI
MRRALWIPLLALAVMAVPQSVSVKAPEPKMFFVFLTKGDKPSPTDAAERTEMMKAHLGNFDAQFKAKKLIAAGPVQDPTQFRRGVVVLTVEDEKEISGLFTDDPFVQKGIMKVDAGLWHADRAGIHDKEVEPEGIEENRIVVVTAESPLTEPETKAFGTHIAATVEKGVGGWVGIPGKRGIFLFQGKEDESLKKAFGSAEAVKIGKLKLEVFPLYMGKKTLAVRS